MPENLRDRLIRTEGKRNRLYRDTSVFVGFEGKKGKITIGVGYNIDDRGLPDDVIYMLLDRDIQAATKDLNTHLPWAANLDWPRRSVLIDLVFNMGIAKVLEFKNTLASIQKGLYREAAAHLKDSLWYRQVGSRGENLCRILEIGEL